MKIIYRKILLTLLLQGARPAGSLHVHGRPGVLQSGLLRGEGREGDTVHLHPRDLLVGGDHDDHGGLRRHAPRQRARKARR